MIQRPQKDKLERNFRSLLDIPETWPPLVKEVTIGRRSSSHIVENYSRDQQNTGVYITGKLFKNHYERRINDTLCIQI